MIISWTDKSCTDLDVVRVCEEHCQSVDAQTPSARWRQRVLERRAVAFIHEHRLVITGVLVLKQRHRRCVTWLYNLGNTFRWGVNDVFALTADCCWKHWRCTAGSFSSVYALQISFLHTNNSKRSVRPGLLRCLSEKKMWRFLSYSIQQTPVQYMYSNVHFAELAALQTD